MTQFQDAPPAEAPKSANSFVHLDPLPESGPQVMTLVATNFIPDYKDVDRNTGETRIYAALELYWGLRFDGKSYFIKTWPMRYSINERANWAKVVKAMTGSLPETGSSPKDVLGKGAMLTIENAEKVSKKGTKYSVSQINGYSPVPKVLVASIAPLDQLLPDLEAALAATQEPF